ncbi:raffinose/stachyose/melibiose transport system permease protein [Paenibacillus sp. 1_12]|nr:carbohydrate ABC transporter permease [Paenibacillus sp. 1_12]SFM44567.1 raffinose/stachyose/melibiose transport system permease protein [Paenibacillus sp. 1_12]
MSRKLGQSVFHIVFIPLVVLWSYPFLWMISSAFKSQKEMLLGGAHLIPETFTLANLERAWVKAKFAAYFFNSVVVTCSVVLLILIISATAGYALARGNMPGKKWIVTGLVATMFLPKGVTILPVFELIQGLGLNNSYAAIILAEAGPANIVAILLFMGYFSNIPAELEESAVMDGAKFLVIFSKIMLPLTKPIIGTVTIFNFIGSWNAFLVPLVFTLSKPKLRTLGVGMYSFFGESAVDWAGFAAGALISVTPTIIIFLFFQRYFIEGLAGAVKG